MAQHRKPSRTVRRVAAIGATTGLALAISAGTATAGSDDDRCQRADGVVVCVPADVDLDEMDVDVNILTHEEDSGFPPVHLGP